MRGRRFAIISFIAGLLISGSGYVGSSHVQLGSQPGTGFVALVETAMSFAAIWVVGATAVVIAMAVAMWICEPRGPQQGD